MTRASCCASVLSITSQENRPLLRAKSGLCLHSIDIINYEDWVKQLRPFSTPAVPTLGFININSSQSDHDALPAPGTTLEEKGVGNFLWAR